MSYKEAEALREHLDELRRTIQFLCKSMADAAEQVDTNPSMAKLILKEAPGDPRHVFH